MRPEDVLKFVEAKTEKYTIKRDASLERFEAYKAEKEASFWYKLFRMKYEREWYDYWDYDKYNYWLVQIAKIKETAEYYHKLNSTDMYDKFPKDWRETFYNWCKENGIP
jgi:hypothetical protein